MKMLKNTAALCILSSLCLCCAACTGTQGASDPSAPAGVTAGAEQEPVQTEQSSPPAETGGDGQTFDYTEQLGQTAVLLQDTTLTDCFSYTYSDPEDDSTYQWLMDLGDAPFAQTAGDIVLLLAEADGLCRVVIPYGEIPWTYGYVLANLISTDPADIEQGNQAFAHDCDGYDSIDGNVVDRLDTEVRILTREGDWASVTEHVGDDSDCWWVRVSDLTFDFDSVVMDLPK